MSFFNCLFQLNHVFINVNSEPTTLFLVIAEDKKIQREKRPHLLLYSYRR